MGLKESWHNAGGKQKRNMVLGGVAAVLILATIAAMITDSVRGTRSGRRKTEVEQVVTPNQRNLTQEGLAAEIYALRNQIQQMQQQQAQKQPENGGGLTEEQVRQIVAESRNTGLENQAAARRQGCTACPQCGWLGAACCGCGGRRQQPLSEPYQQQRQKRQRQG